MAAGAMSTYLRSALLNAVFRNSAFSSPATVYIALFTVAPADGGAGYTEVSGGSYARQSVTFAAPVGGPPDTISLNAVTTFPNATANWGTVVAVGFFDASSGGNLLAWANLTANQTINSGGTYPTANGDVTVEAD